VITKKTKKGLIPKTVEYLLNRNQEMEGVRELILTCNFVEIYLDQVRDLAHNYVDRSNMTSTQRKSSGNINTAAYENESLEIYEHANGQMLIRNVRNVIVRSMEDVYDLIGTGFAMRDKAETKEKQIWARAHTIFTINIVQKEVENEDLPFPKSMIQFVDLAGSERIAKSITEGQHKFQEAVMIMSHLTSLYKVLSAVASNSKNIPFRDSKLTKTLYNCINSYNNVILLAHLHAGESNFEETLNTLQYAERCKSNDMKGKSGMPGNFSAAAGMEDSGLMSPGAGNIANDKLWKKMNEELNDVKSKFENYQKEHKAKLERIQMYLGLDIDLDKVTVNAASKEVQVLTQMKNISLENQNLKLTIQTAEEQFENMRKEFDDERREIYHKKAKTESRIVEIREQMKKDADKLKGDRHKVEEELRKQIDSLTEENKKLLAHNTELLNEKTQAIMNFNSNLNSKTREINQTLDMKNIGKREAEIHYKDELIKLKTDHKVVTDNLKDQYEHWLKLKNEEMDKYAERVQEFQQKKKEQIDGMRVELQELYCAYQRLENIIDKVESGAYSGGIRSFFIPAKERGLKPNRQRYPYLYQVLDQKLSETTTKSLYREKDLEDTKNIDPFNQTKKSNGMWGNGTKSLNRMMLPSHNASLSITAALSPKNDLFTTPKNDTIVIQNTLPRPDVTLPGMFPKTDATPKNNPLSTRQPDWNNDVDLDVNVAKLQPDDLKRYADNLKKFCKELKVREKELKVQADQFVALNVYGDIHELIRERDRYKNMYKEENKKNTSSKVMLDSQKRLIKNNLRSINNTLNGTGTGGYRPTTSGYY